MKAGYLADSLKVNNTLSTLELYSNYIRKRRLESKVIEMGLKRNKDIMKVLEKSMNTMNRLIWFAKENSKRLSSFGIFNNNILIT